MIWLELSKEIQVLKQERRFAKDMVEALTPLVDYCERFAQAKNNLTQFLGDIRKVESYQNNRHYKAKMPELQGSEVHNVGGKKARDK